MAKNRITNSEMKKHTPSVRSTIYASLMLVSILALTTACGAPDPKVRDVTDTGTMPETTRTDRPEHVVPLAPDTISAPGAQVAPKP